jgi:ATP-binding cassette subfamily B (MDR/TAP) protein 6
LQIVDMLAAATYLAGALEPWVALIVFVTIGSYIPLTIIVTEWRGNFRRDMNKTGAPCRLFCCVSVCQGLQLL